MLHFERIFISMLEYLFILFVLLSDLHNTGFCQQADQAPVQH